MSETGGRQLGPRKRWDDDRRRHAAPWHRHLPWLLPVAACGVFLILIVGAMGMRRIIWVTRQDRAADEALRQSASTPSATAGTSTKTFIESATEIGSDRDATSAAVKSAAAEKQPTLELLPPLAAREPGRKLPRMLVVGDHPDMFASIEQALNVAISGDIIEIRTNRPMVVTPTRYEAEDKQTVDKLIIRAGRGFQPVLRGGANVILDNALFSFVNTRLTLAGLHFVGFTKAVAFLHVRGGELQAIDCSFTVLGPPVGQSRSAITSWSYGPADGILHDAQIRLERCLFRGNTFDIIRCHMVASVEITDCLIVTWGWSRFCSLSGYSLPSHPEWRHNLVLRNNTIISDHAITTFGGPNPAMSSVQAEGNVIVTVRMVSHYDESERDTFHLFKSLHSWRGAGNVFSFGEDPETSMVLSGSAKGNQRLIRVPPSLPQWNSFWGAQVEVNSKIGTVVFARAIDPADPDGQNWGWKRAPPEFQVEPLGAVTYLAGSGVRVGCDVTKVPVPPSATLEHYDPAEPKN